MVKAQITRHVNVHSEIKPYLCRECGKGFNFKQKVNHVKWILLFLLHICTFECIFFFWIYVQIVWGTFKSTEKSEVILNKNANFTYTHNRA